MHNDDILVIGTGSVGGKSAGFQKVHDHIKQLSSNDKKILTENVLFPKTAFLTTSFFKEFIEHNKLHNLISKVERSDFNTEDCETVRKAFLEGTFSGEAAENISKLLNTFTNPIIARSSSLLEDQKGSAFAGKYESFFISNRGSLEERGKMFLEAIKKVYSSTYNPNALKYRTKHGFLDSKEEMGVLVQEIVGNEYKSYFLPAMSGVAFSQNGYCWNKGIKKEDGLVRLVFGLGTRAVGRGYVRLFSPAKPSVRPEGTDVTSIQKCSQKNVDVIDLENNCLTTIHFRELMKNGFDCYPGSQSMASLKDGSFLYRPVSNMWDNQHIPVLTMDGVLTSEWMKLDIPKVLSALMKELEAEFHFPIDLEFAININLDEKRGYIYLLQTRPLSEREGSKPIPIPHLEKEEIIISAKGNVPTSFVPDIEYLIYVDDIAYNKWPHREKQTVARTIGKINELMKSKRYALIGPGRWGSWNPDLGVPVNYSEISNCLLLIEVARRQATYLPEVSFGSHFFQDLIEDNISYLPVYPDENDSFLNEKLFQTKSEFPKVLTDDFYRQFDNLIKIIYVPNIRKESRAHAILNGETENAVIYIGKQSNDGILP